MGEVVHLEEGRDLYKHDGPVDILKLGGGLQTGDDELWVPASELHSADASLIGGQADTATFLRWSLSATVEEHVRGWLPPIPALAPWETADVELVWGKEASGSGDVRLGFGFDPQFPGDDFDGIGTDSEQTVAVPGTIALDTRTTLATGIALGTVNGKRPLVRFYAARMGDDAADTYAGEIGVVAVRFIRKS